MGIAGSHNTAARLCTRQGECEKEIHANKHEKETSLDISVYSCLGRKEFLHDVMPSCDSGSSGYSDLHLSKLLFSVVAVEMCSDMPVSLPIYCICMSYVKNDIILNNGKQSYSVTFCVCCCCLLSYCVTAGYARGQVCPSG